MRLKSTLLFFVLTLSTLLITNTLAQPAIQGYQVTLKVESLPDSYDEDDLDEAARIISNRLSALGAANYLVQIIGNDHIQIQFKVDGEPDSYIAAVAQVGLLELVDFSDMESQQLSSAAGLQVYTTYQDANQGRFELPDPGILNPVTGEPFETLITGDEIAAAAASSDPNSGWWNVQIDFTDEGGAVMGAHTEAHIGSAIAIVLDGVVLSAPTVQARVEESAVIAGNFDETEAQRLAAQLRFGALPLRVSLETINTVRTVSVAVETE